MTAETLRKAAAAMRLESYTVRRPYGRDEHFKLAVADLLEQVAESDFRDYGSIETCTSVGSDALAVARAYLGATP